MDVVKKLITVAILVLLVAELGGALMAPAEAGHAGPGAGTVDGGHIKFSKVGGNNITRSRSTQWADCQRKCGEKFWGCSHEKGDYSAECQDQVGACRRNCPPEVLR